MRGTPSSLYGTDAVGGVVQLVTRAPHFDGLDTQVRGTAMLGFDSADLGKSLRSTLDVGNRRFAASMSAEYLETGNRRIGGGTRVGPSGYEAKAGRLLLAGAPNEDFSWLFDVHYLEQPETPMNSLRDLGKPSHRRPSSCSHRTDACSRAAV